MPSREDDQTEPQNKEPKLHSTIGASRLEHSLLSLECRTTTPAAGRWNVFNKHTEPPEALGIAYGLDDFERNEVFVQAAIVLVLFQTPGCRVGHSSQRPRLSTSPKGSSLVLVEAAQRAVALPRCSQQVHIDDKPRSRCKFSPSLVTLRPLARIVRCLAECSAAKL